MQFKSSDQWRDLMSLDPEGLTPDELRAAIVREVQTRCNRLNQAQDRRTVSQELEMLARVGRLLQDHAWLGGRS